MFPYNTLDTVTVGSWIPAGFHREVTTAGPISPPPTTRAALDDVSKRWAYSTAIARCERESAVSRIQSAGTTASVYACMQRAVRPVGRPRVAGQAWARPGID
jgi:hypothetical protein